MDQALTLLNHFFTLWVIFPLILIFGFYLSIRLNFIQFTKLKLGFTHLFKKEKNEEGNISNFQAVSAVLAGNLGTGNISGMAVAVTSGGPGALVWMWVMALFGAIIKYAGCFLALNYREKNKNGEYVGGPMYYISKGLSHKPLAILFSICAILTAITVGNFVQVNSIILPATKVGLSPILIVVLLAAIAGVVIIGGLSRLARVVGTLVPLMSLLYISAAFVILFYYRALLPDAFITIVKAAFSPKSIIGGGAGYGIMRAISVGFERGIFATDAGCGIAPILQSSARCKKPVIEGIVGMIAPLIVMTICTLTALVLIVTDAAMLSGEQSTNMCTWAFKKGLSHQIGSVIVIISLILFAFTTIITWAFCGEKAIEFLFRRQKAVKFFKYFFILLIPFGAFFRVHTVWLLADFSIGLMLVTNLIGVISLSSEVISKTNEQAELKGL